jgi:ubiquinone/menaquinone biosynthesis C-methylase UbiE
VEHVEDKIVASGAQNVRVVQANASATGLPDQSFDLAFVFGLAHPIGSMEGIWTEIHRLLKPGGTLAVEGRLQPPSILFLQTRRQRRTIQYVWTEP